MTILAWCRVGPTGNWNGNPSASPVTGVGGIDLSAIGTNPMGPIVSISGGGQQTFNFGNAPFAGTVPAGYTAGWPAAGGGFTAFDPSLLVGTGTFSNSNRTFTQPGLGPTQCQVPAADLKSSGAYYFEMHYDSHGPLSVYFGGGIGRQYPGLDYASFSNSTSPGKYGGTNNNGGIALLGNYPNFAPDPYHTVFGALANVLINQPPTESFTYQVGTTVCWAIDLSFGASPVGLACGTATATSITAMWQPVGVSPDSYTLQWGLSAGGPFTTVTGILTTSYVVSGLAPGTTVFWRVAAVTGGTTSPYTVLTTCSTGGAIVALTSAVAIRRWRGLVGINWLGFPLVGDGFAPVVGLSDFNAFEEFGQPMIMTVTTPPLQNDRKRIFVTRFEIDMQVGDGLPNLPEDGGTVLLSVSKDSGMIWGTLMKPRSMGAIGEYRTRLRWLNLGQSRAWVFKLVISDPVRRQIIGAYWTGYEALG